MCTLLSSFLIFISMPLALFGLLTTSFAFSTLFLRVIVVYAELAVVLVRDQFPGQVTLINIAPPPKIRSPAFGEKEQSRINRRGSTGRGDSGSRTPRIPETNGLGIYSGGGIGRDFEGVGGWMFPNPDDEDGLWTSMNSRLELPATICERKRHHCRSFTSSSLSSASLVTRSPVRSRTRTPYGTRASRNASPEEYFVERPSSRSTTALDTANISRALLRSKTSSVSTVYSDNLNRSSQSRTHI